MAISDTQRELDKGYLKSKPRGVSSGEYLMRGSTAKWQRGRYRKQAEAQEAKEHQAYRKDNPNVKAGEAPIEGTKEEYIRRNQLQDKIGNLSRSKGRAGKKTATRKRVSGK